MPMTPYARTAVLNGTAHPTTLNLQHHTGDPGVDGSANASTDAGPSNRRTLALATAVAGATSNSAIVDVNLTVGQTYSHYSLWDATSNCWWTGAWTTPRTFLAGDTARIPVGALDLALT